MTNVTEPDRTPWRRTLGPWPLQPLPLAIIFGLASTALGLEPGRWIEQWPNIVVGVLVGLITWTVLSAAARWFGGLVQHLGGYLAVLALNSLITTILREFVGVLPGSPNVVLRFGFTVLISTLFLALLQALLGTASARLQREVDRSTLAMEMLQEQQTALLRADESVRQSVAVVLHDQVQAGLVSACMRLQSIRSDPESKGEHREVASDVIAQLELLRSLDLRRAVRSLSPNLRDVDMLTALEDLAETWSSGLMVDVSVNGQLPRDHDLRLGAYRIIEQGLLNVASHADAHSCEVRLQVGDSLRITIDDDGAGIRGAPVPGLGSTLLTTWCHTLGGTWSWEGSPLGGTRLIATLPLPTSPLPR